MQGSEGSKISMVHDVGVAVVREGERVCRIRCTFFAEGVRKGTEDIGVLGEIGLFG